MYLVQSTNWGQVILVQIVSVVQIVSAFEEGGGTRVSGEKPLGVRTRTTNKLNTHMTPSLGIEPEPSWWEMSALTTAPPLLNIFVCGF